LRAVGMIGVWALPRRDAEDFNIKGMPFLQVGRERLAPQCLRDLFAGSGELSFGGRPGQLNHAVRVDLKHKSFPHRLSRKKPCGVVPSDSVHCPTEFVALTVVTSAQPAKLELD